MKKQTYKLDIPIPANVKRIYNAFKKENVPLFLVGGAVRDALLGKTPKDYDLATSAVPSQVVAIANKHDLHVVDSLGNNHGVTIVDGEEIATFRADIGSGRRPDAVEFTNMETDVKRRDLTINALYYDIYKGQVIDFVGGVEDIRNAKIRTVGQPTDRFDEDALRKLRAVRFAGRMGSKMDKATYEAIKRDPSLPGVSGERIRDEFMKGIRTAKSPKSYILLCFELKLMPLILPSMKLRKPSSESRDPIVQIADMLRGNDLNKVNKLLNAMKYSKRENAQVRFLLEFVDFHIDKLTILKRAEERCGISKESLLEFGVIIKKRREAVKFANFKLSVRGGDAPKDLPKKSIGKWMQDAEREKYLNEVNMRESTLRRIIREEMRRLNEGVTDIVYHYTNMKAALNILEKDKFLLRPALASSGDVETKFSSGRLYFLSTTRSKVDGFSSGNVRFTLDGRALGQRYKGNPIDYWQWDKSKDSYDNLGGWKSAVTSKEHEDRIVSDSPYIPNASKYIKEMHIFMWKANQLIATLQHSALIRNVPVFVYDDKSAYKLGNKKKAIDLSVALANKEVPIDIFDYNPVMRDSFPYDLAVLVSFGSKKALNTITKLVPDKGKFRKLFAKSTPYSRFGYERERLYDFREAGKSSKPNERKLVDYIIREMRKQGIKTFAEYCIFLEARAKKNGK